MFSPLTFLHVPLWRKVDKMVLSLSLRELDLFPRTFQNCKDIDVEVDRLVRWIKETVAQHILFSKLTPFSVL
jgi:hypothetical protein